MGLFSWIVETIEDIPDNIMNIIDDTQDALEDFIECITD